MLNTRRMVARAAIGATMLVATTFGGVERSMAVDIQRSLLQSTAIFVNQHGGGSGWVFDTEQRLLLTSQYVVGSASKVTVFFPIYQNGTLVTDVTSYGRTTDLRGQGNLFQGRVLDCDSRHDLAVVQLEKLPPNVRALQLADGPASTTDAVHSLSGPAAGQMWFFADGVVRQISGQKFYLPDGTFLATRFLASTLLLQYRDRGGPVLNDSGKVVAACCVLNNQKTLASFCIDWQAIHDYLQAAHGLVNPQTAIDYRKIADRYFIEQNWAEAEKAYRKAIDLAPADESLRVDLAGALARQEEQADATAALDQAAAGGDKMAIAWIGAGGIPGRLGLTTAPMQLDNPPSFDLAAETSVRYFRNGAIFYRSNGKFKDTAVAVRGAISGAYFNSKARYTYLGAPIAAEIPATKSSTGTTGAIQLFEGGAIVRQDNGPDKGHAYAIFGDVWTLYNSQGATGSKLGFPTGDLTLANNVYTQTYEEGLINWTPGKDHGNIVPAAAPRPAPATEAAKEIYARVLQSTAYVDDVVRGASGTAWIIDRPDRLLITNFHVVWPAVRPVIYFPCHDPKTGKLIANFHFYSKNTDALKKSGVITYGRVLYADAAVDLAVIQAEQLPTGTLALELAPASATKGDPIYTVGNESATNSLWNYSQGKVTDVMDWRQNRQFNSGAQTWMIETDLPVNSGDSGGPDVNSVGKLVAMNELGAVNSSLPFPPFLPARPVLTDSIDVRAVKDFSQLFPKLIKPTTSDDFRRIGTRYFFEKNLPAAEQAQRAAHGLGPSSLPAEVDLAITLMAEGKDSDAEPLLAHATAAGDSAAKAWAALGGPKGELGSAVGNPGYNDPSGEARIFQNGAIFAWTAGPNAGSAFVMQGAIAKAYLAGVGTSFVTRGFATSAELAAKSPQGTTGTQQLFQSGEAVVPSSGPQKGQVIFVDAPYFAIYQSLGGTGSKLGFPTGNSNPAMQVPTQVFEGGRISIDRFTHQPTATFTSTGTAQ